MKILYKTLLVIILCLYLAILTKMVLFKYIPLTEIIRHFNFTYDEYHWRSQNFTPFKTIYFYLFVADINQNIKVENLAGNIIGFVPLGILLPLLSKKFRTFTAVLMTSFGLSLTYEVLQLLFEFGSFDVDDLILNTLGGALGFIPLKLLFFLIRLKQNPADKP